MPAARAAVTACAMLAITGWVAETSQNGWDADYVEAGDAGSPNFHKSNALKTMRKRPEHGFQRIRFVKIG
jgi:hypothetical protein